MNIGLIGDSTKKQLIKNLCIAYSFILSKHELYATDGTGHIIESVTNLNIHKLKTGSINSLNDFLFMIEHNQLDALIYLLDPESPDVHSRSYHKIFRACDMYNIPYATNLGSAELIIQALQRGDLEWREYYR